MSTPKYSKENVINNIIGNYRQVEQSIVNQLYMQHDIHGPTVGSEREDVWREMFEAIIPKKFVIESSIFVIDSTFNETSQEKEPFGISKEVDLAIIDEMYTPYIFRYGRLKFVPIEAVAAVIECKSKSSDTRNWIARINGLETSNKGIVRMVANIVSVKSLSQANGVPAQTQTRPLKIFCGLGLVKDHIAVKENFDFILLAYKQTETSELKSENAKIEVITPKGDWSLNMWHQYLNLGGCDTEEKIHEEKDKISDAKENSLEKYNLSDYYTVNDSEGGEISLLTFNFQLNQLLMIINNPLLFPHQAYVRMFNKKEEPEKKESEVSNG